MTATTDPQTQEPTQEPPASDEQPKKGNPKRSEYAVMVCVDTGHEFETAEDALLKGDWNYVGNYVVLANGGQSDARRQAYDDPDNERLVEAVDDGAWVHFLCLPRRSLHPFKAGIEQRDPQLVI